MYLALTARAGAAGVEVRVLVPQADDFNSDLIALGQDVLAASLARQLAPEDPAPTRPRPWHPAA